MNVLYYDARKAGWFILNRCLDTLSAESIEAIQPLVSRVSEVFAEGCYYILLTMDYEAAHAFDGHYRTASGAEGHPLAKAYFFREKIPVDPYDLQILAAYGYECGGFPCLTSPFIAELDFPEYKKRFNRIKEHLEAGDTYQINLTYRLKARYSGNPLDWFLKRITPLPGSYPFYIMDGQRTICSLSPELFFDLGRCSGGEYSLTLKPMKGTAAKIEGKEEAAAESLRNDGKNRAENLMITDMIRNDAGKIAVSGSVAVPELYGTEILPSVIQMTSTVKARTTGTLADIFASLFPCASITGAPKIRSMEIISESEKSPRGLYTGTIGVFEPDGSGFCNVAIRTAVFDRNDYSASGVPEAVLFGAHQPERNGKNAQLKLQLWLNRANSIFLKACCLKTEKYCLQKGILRGFKKAWSSSASASSLRQNSAQSWKSKKSALRRVLTSCAWLATRTVEYRFLQSL